MALRSHALFWILTATGLAAVIWLLNDILLPFVVGLAIAYLLGPFVTRMIKAGVPRAAAAGMILLVFFVVVAVILALILPFAYREAVQLANDLPLYAEKAEAYLTPYIEWVQARFNAGDMSSYQQTLKDNVGKLFKFGGNVVGGLVSGGQAVVGAATFLILTPFAAYFMMAEWVRIIGWIDDMIPRRNYETIRGLLTQMDRKVSGFVRGQIIISLVLAVAYAVALMLAGLKFGFLIGLLAGLLSIIPLVGSTFGLVVAVTVAWFQTQELSYVGLIAAIFLFGQFMEGNVITPKILGKNVGLHPLWILFALLAGGALFGIVGMLLAVPVAAVIGVLAAFAIKEYKESPYYESKTKPKILPSETSLDQDNTPPHA
jgi:predicted PurR-regulated permease PerM